jgi:hypothetical protein
LPERSERTIFGLDPAKSAAKPIRDREDRRIDSITIVPSASLQQHLVAAKFASGTGFLPPIAAPIATRNCSLAAGLARPVHSRDQSALFEFGTGFLPPETDAQKRR